MTIRRSVSSIPLLLVALIAVAVFASSGSAAREPSPTLAVTFSPAGSAATSGSSVPYGTPYVVSGCGYGSTTGVTIVVHSPEAISFAGQIPDSNGCISVSNFSTQGAGSYTVDAYQQVHNKSSIVASTGFTLS